MSRPPKLVAITGGPGAGKTAILEVARRVFCEHVAVLPEAATILFGGGFPRRASSSARCAGQRAVFHVQRELERMRIEEGGAAIILCDRGTLDGVAYWPPDGASLWIDAAIAIAWEGHPRRFFVDATPDFLTKVNRVVSLIAAEVPTCCRPTMEPSPQGSEGRSSRGGVALIAAALMTAAACGGASQPARPMSVAEHEQRADAEEREAKRHLSVQHPRTRHRPEDRYRCIDQPLAGVPYSGGQPLEVIRPCWTDEVDPNEVEARDAHEHRRVAAEHRKHAAQLVSTERKACSDIGEHELSHSPFYHRRDVLRVSPVRDKRNEIVGARIVFRRVPGLDAAVMRKATECHQARAAVMGYAESFMPYCPLTVAHSVIEVVETSDGIEVALTSKDPRAAATLWGRALALAPARPSPAAPRR